MNLLNRPLSVKAKDEILGGHYTNMMNVAHSEEEFILDFILAMPPQAELQSRIVLSPRHMKRVLRALNTNIAKYEEKYGQITEAQEPKLLE